MMHLPLVFGLALVLSLGLTPMMIRLLAKSRVMDIPNRRSSHAIPVPRGGGFGILLPTFLIVGVMLIIGVLALDVFVLSVLAGMAGMMAIGFFDDVFSLPASTRLILEGLLMAGFLAVSSLPLSEIALPMLPSIEIGALGWILAWLFLVGFSNLFNFMDGIDGLAGTQTLIACAALAILALASGNETVAVLAAVIAGGGLGFLRYNFPRAEVFMGDSGSLPIGFFLAAAALDLSSRGTGVPIIVPVLVVWVFLFDACLTLLIRSYRGRRLHHAHREHIYQRLVGIGYSHARVTGIYSVFMLAAAAIAMIYLKAEDPLRLALLVGLLVTSLALTTLVFRAHRKIVSGGNVRVE